MELPPQYRRSLSVTASVIEKSLDSLERLLTAPRQSGSAHRVEPAYSRAEREALLESIRLMKAANAEMVTVLQLKPSHVLESQIVRSTLTHLWTTLVDSKSTALKGFGELSSESAAAIDAQVERLLALLADIEARQ